MRSSLVVFGCSLVNAHSYGLSLTLSSPVSAEPPKHTTNCYGFPDQPFTLSNHVNICDPSGCSDDGLGVKTNDAAPNFQANDVAGARIDLHDLLKSKPVFIQFGSFTWPIFQEGISATNKLADFWGSKLTYLLVYTIDAHPKKPDPSPYLGKPWMMPFSELPQPRTFNERLTNAKDVNHGMSRLHGNFSVLVDDLTPHNSSAGNDPVWCSWGPAPNAGFFVLQNHTVALAQTWFSLHEMNASIANFFY